MRFDIITIFPEIFDFYLKHSILEKAQKRGCFQIGIHNLRDFTEDKNKTVDDKPFGGGRGMVLKIDPIYKAVKKIKKDNKTKVVLFTPRGKKFNQKMATNWAKLDQLILISGRYEGIDERVKHIVDEKVSIGNYVLMSGDIPALAVIEATARLLPGVVGKSESLIKDRITKTKGFIEYPQYTRPETFEINKTKRKVPKVL
ncbi:MAG: tRNA (guanosine(37)-N1)-methyltransferase TrmD, partial [Parcubacteria group bacterium]|nr:tRNA (guanosine(37)-N1)-methyltransferase TrmD [Parcubacteria group bacterium]